MVVQFLTKTKDGLFNKLGLGKDNVKQVNSLILDIDRALSANDFEHARDIYLQLSSIYKGMHGELKNKVYDKCVEIHSKIMNKDTSSVEEIRDDFPELPIDSHETAQRFPEILETPKAEEVEYLKTGVPGFDELIEKGIPRGSNILVSGSAGSGKTTFASQMLMNNAANGKKCLFMSFEESEDRLKRHLRQYGNDPDRLISDGTLLIRRYDPFLISRSIEALLAEARGELVIQIDKTKGLIPDNFQPDIVVVDSLSAIGAAFAEQEAAYRIYIEQLFRSFEKLGLTSFLITECEEGTGKFSKTGVEEFLADGVIAFYNMKRGNSRIPATEVVKLRGVGHKKKIVPFSFVQGKGIEVYPLQEIFME